MCLKSYPHICLTAQRSCQNNRDVFLYSNLKVKTKKNNSVTIYCRRGHIVMLHCQIQTHKLPVVDIN